MFFRTPTDPPEPSPPDLTEAEAGVLSITNSMLGLRECLTPAFDAADGMRADLIARGWSSQAAEVLSVTWLQRMITNLNPPIGGSK
ncbi:hypothetical protein ABZ454_38865 [Streptomyces sp. NPDC005803]|uniref:hypothetical protein n=1 Tax=Streptomyces sp. NPDC005803 TaxID=3154297 RepID=UPI0033F16823